MFVTAITAPRGRITRLVQHERERWKRERLAMDTQDSGTVFKLPVALDFAASDGFLDTVRQLVHDSPRLHFDASEVETLTLPCAQIILAALSSRAEIAVERPSQAFLDAFADFGIDISAHCKANEHVEAEVSVDEAIENEAAAPDEASAQEVSMSKRILTIDDSKTIRDMLRLTLLEAGFEVHQAVDGMDGVDILDKEQFDVVITDINMPKMDGYGVIRHMRSVPEHKTTPILVLTTESEGSKRNLAREAGATGWMVKPFDPEQLVATINKVAP